MADSRRIVDALVRARRGGVAAGAALGGLALIGGTRLPRPARDRAPATGGPDFTAVGEDEARLMLRAMVAATTADGMTDAAERKRLDAAVAEAGIDADGRSWLERELASPAEIDEIAERVAGPEAAARIYAAARLAIDPDTLQERQFLKMLAEALDLPAEASDRVERDIAA
ncbi:DUF533 domain-containing protein [Methylobacterium oryzae CBMB20]